MTMIEWVPVSERMPATKESVLIYWAEMPKEPSK